ncbi:MAG TPA: 4-hydroxybutyrate dehydrogenase, partial [Microvirga sp.]|nr:4-hydroxybutyrate dehydrogenase [Microvirga sp.]
MTAARRTGRRQGSETAMGLITYLTTIRFESGAVKDIAADLAGLGIARPLVVTDAGVVAAGLIA